MQPRGLEPGPITRFLAEDHRRLEQLLQTALMSVDHLAQGAYDRFRSGLLRHIGMEEKILLPAAQRWNEGKPLSIAVKLRLDHGAIAALLMPTPTAGVIAALNAILGEHNLIEEGPEGLYNMCDTWADPEIERLMAKLRAAPEVAVLPHSNTPAVLDAVRRAVKRAGYEYSVESPAT